MITKSKILRSFVLSEGSLPAQIDHLRAALKHEAAVHDSHGSFYPKLNTILLPPTLGSNEFRATVREQILKEGLSAFNEFIQNLRATERSVKLIIGNPVPMLSSWLESSRPDDSVFLTISPKPDHLNGFFDFASKLGTPLPEILTSAYFVKSDLFFALQHCTPAPIKSIFFASPSPVGKLQVSHDLLTMFHEKLQIESSKLYIKWTGSTTFLTDEIRHSSLSVSWRVTERSLGDEQKRETLFQLVKTTETPSEIVAANRSRVENRQRKSDKGFHL